MLLDRHGVIGRITGDTADLFGISPEHLVNSSLYGVIGLSSFEDLTRIRLEASQGPVGTSVEASLRLGDGRTLCRCLLVRESGQEGELLLIARPGPGAANVTDAGSASALQEIAAVRAGEAGLDDALARIGRIIVTKALPVFAGVQLTYGRGESLHQAMVGDPRGDLAPAAEVAVSIPCGADAFLRAEAWALEEFDAEVTRESLRPFVHAAAMFCLETDTLARLTRQRDQLQEALLSRATIDQAKGMIMMSAGCSADAAFAQLLHLSSTKNVKVKDLAASIVADFAKRGKRSPDG